MRLPLALSLLLVACVSPPDPPEKGRLVIVGGGTTSAEVAKKTLEIAGGAEKRMLILPQVSEDPEIAGRESAEFWRSQGVKEVSCLDLSDPKKAVAAVETADLIWIPGGDQNRFMKVMAGTGIVEAIRKRYAEGATVGGTSAGAALMSEVMISGDPESKEDPDAPTPTAAGLALWPEVIVDQHFSTRGRFSRLMRAVLDHPTLVGVGIDQGTGIVVTGRALEVFGSGAVTVLDARKAVVTKSKEGIPSASGVVAHLLRAGARFDLDRGKLGD